MANLIVRAVQPRDYEQWLPLWDGYNAFYGRSGPTALPLENTRVTWQRFFDDSEPVHALVAEQDGRLLGLVHYLYHRTTTTIGLVCYLNDLFTNADARGKGVGRALIQAVYGEAKRSGSPRVYWLTHQTNATARALYDQVADNTGHLYYRKDM